MAHRADPLSRAPVRGALLLGLAALELAWFAWFLSEPLPNAGNIGGPIRRGFLLMQAFPEVVPDLGFEQSLLGQALAELSHVENLPQRLPIVLAAALIAGAALALGQLVIRALGLRSVLSRLDRIPLAFGLGTSGLALIVLLLGRLGLLAPWPIRVGLGLLVVQGAWSSWAEGWSRPRISLTALGPLLIVAPFVLVMALGAMLPATDFDAVEYHLQGPKEAFQAGRIAFLPHNVYTSMPFNVEMLHLLGMVVLGDWWRGALVGQLLVAAFAPAAALMIARVALRWASSRAAWVAAIVYLSTPWVYRIAVIPYVEGPLCFYHAALIWAVARAWDADPGIRTRLWSVAGLLAGGAMACKYPALVSAVLPFGVLALFEAFGRRSWRIVLAFSAGWAVVMIPWLAKNLIDTGNPVYPLAYRVFGGRLWDAAREAQWSRVHGPKPISARALTGSFLEVAGQSDWQSPLYVALAPLALLRRGTRRQALALIGYALYLFLSYWLLTHRLDRFWLPILPPLAILAGLGADWARGRAWSILLAALLAVATILNFTFISTPLAGFNEWTGNLRALRGEIPKLLNPPLARLNSELPPRARVLLVGQAGVFHLDHPVVYNTVFNDEIIETLARDHVPEQVRRGLARLGVTHVYVDWHEIERYRSPGNYGFTAFVTPEVFARLVASGVLEPPQAIGPEQALYRVP